MKFYLKQGLLFFLAIFFFIFQAQAQNVSEYVSKVDIQLQGGFATGRILIPEQLDYSTPIYTEGGEGYLEIRNYQAGIGDKIDYVPIGVNDKNVNLITKVFFDQARLESLAGWNDYNGIWVHKSCTGTALGDQYFPTAGEFYPIADLKANNYTISFAPDPDCKKDLFLQKNKLTIEFKLNKDKGSAFSPKKAEYTFTILPKPLLNACQLAIKDALGNTIRSADNNTDIIVSGENIDDGGLGYHLYLDNSLKKSYEEESDDFTTSVTDGPPTFTYNLGKLSVGDHQLVVKQDETNIPLCLINLPIFLTGTTPTPFSEVTRPPDKDGYIDSTSILQIERATTIPLCKSITDSKLRAKCEQCQGNDTIEAGVWTGIGCLPTNFNGLVSSIFELFSGMLGGLIFLCVVSNGIKIMTSRGNPEALKKGQEAITACLVGFVVLAMSVLFLKIVGVDILKLPGWN